MVLPLDEKLPVLNSVSEGKKKKDVASQYCIPPGTLSTVSKVKDSLLETASSGVCGSRWMKLKMQSLKMWSRWCSNGSQTFEQEISL